MPLFAWFVELAARPSFYESWGTRKVGEISDEPLLIPAAEGRYWTFWQKTGFSVFTKGKEDVFEGIIPELDCTAPISRAVMEFLQEEIRDVAERLRDASLIDDSRYLSEHFFVHDSIYVRTFEKELCAPEVMSLREYRYFYPDSAAHEGIVIRGRNFVWDGAFMSKILLTDLFDPSKFKIAFALVEKEVIQDLIDQNLYEARIRDFYLDPAEEFLISREGLKILFQRYAWGGYYSVDSVATVPWNRLSSFLKPDTPVTRWVERELQKQR